MNANDLYSALAGNAWKLAARSALDADDIRQELYLLCMEVADGRSKYTPVIGGVHEYIMGRLWGLIRKWPDTYTVEDFIDNEDGNVLTEFIPVALHAPSVEETLMQRDDLLEQDAIDINESRRMRESERGQTTLALLIKSGLWSTRDAAVFCGVSHMTISRHYNKTKHFAE